jgi:hypothetical protein
MAQPLYISLTSTSTAAALLSPWKTANWWSTPQQISFAVISTGGSSWAVVGCYEDPSGTFQSPNYGSTVGSTAVTSFSIQTGGANAAFSVPSSLTPIAGFQCQVNALSSAGAKVLFVTQQSGSVTD